MKKDKLYIEELKKTFSGKKFFSKKELRDFYLNLEIDLSENTFRRILYSLENRGVIYTADAGVYVLKEGQIHTILRVKFVPTLPSEIRDLYNSLKAAFPYAKFLVWETRILHDLMLHRPGQSQIVVETEKETTESIFNYLSDKNFGSVYLKPNREIFERYVLPSTNSIIVLPLITRAPIQKVDGILFPKLEKLLVDVFADDDLFFLYQGRELVNIFETAFSTYRVSEKALFYYAKRRKADKKIALFINQKTNIQLLQFGALKR